MNLTIEGSLKKNHLKAFAEQPHFDEVYVKDFDILTVSHARSFQSIQSVNKIKLWCPVTRAALRYIVSCPHLKELIVFELRSLGKLTGFENAMDMTDFYALFGLKSLDLLEISKCPNLQKLGAQKAELTAEALAALMAIPTLSDVDFEDSNFNDDFADIVSQSNTIEKLEIGETYITRKGLAKICRMKQLKGLDVWSNDIDAADLALLSTLSNLEYLSFGGHDEQTKFTTENSFPHLEPLTSLKHVWLDGLTVTQEEWTYLNNRYESVKVTDVRE